MESVQEDEGRGHYGDALSMLYCRCCFSGKAAMMTPTKVSPTPRAWASVRRSPRMVKAKIRVNTGIRLPKRATMPASRCLSAKLKLK